MNDFIASLYDPWFNYELYKDLQDSVFNAFDFQKLGWSLIIVSIILLLVFYKLWDPVKKPRFKWIITLLFAGIFMFAICYALLFNNIELLQYLGNYTGDVGEPNPQYFILQMAVISFVYGVALAGLLSIPIKYISVGNKHNPF
ncbi:hypothetical protein GCM10022271_07730 [Corallibacter vietnamensis]|uniref:Uncharacterized protein n=1 Tax=Corallibacter vietnamensis TaxID=904130 RepID=A0ABP7GX16_9FLAO